MLQWLKNITAPKLDPSSLAPAELVGTEATVVKNSLMAGKIGQVKCNGTGKLAKARLAEGPVAELAEGAIVTITATDDGLLTVAPRQL